MNNPNNQTMKTQSTRHPFLIVAALVSTMLFTAGCGSTKVYEVKKTVVYDGSMYNITDVRSVQSYVEGLVGPEQVKLNLKNSDKDAFENYLSQYGQVFVRMYFTFDEQTIVYREETVDRWRDFKNMRRDFDQARDKIIELMEDKKATQVELR